LGDDVADLQQFLGLGWAFPVTFGNQGRSVVVAEAEEDIRQSLEILLSTRLGERVLNPTYGWKRDALMFEPLSTSFAAYLSREIETAILFFESRIELNQVTFDAAPDQQGLVLIKLDYTIRTTNTRTNLVYPFYVDQAINA
jgi:Bacteriophage baseplate protein W